MSKDGTNRLVKMANQIADNFAYGDQDKAVAGVLDHIMRFWTLDMKQTIIEQKSAGEIGLNELASKAIDALELELGKAA